MTWDQDLYRSRAEGRATDPRKDPPPLPGQPRPRCPVCQGVACPECHRADMVVTVWDFPEGGWHHICRRCAQGFGD